MKFWIEVTRRIKENPWWAMKFQAAGYKLVKTREGIFAEIENNTPVFPEPYEGEPISVGP
jgi:hypothetical protein